MGCKGGNERPFDQAVDEQEVVFHTVVKCKTGGRGNGNRSGFFNRDFQPDDLVIFIAPDVERMGKLRLKSFGFIGKRFRVDINTAKGIGVGFQ